MFFQKPTLYIDGADSWEFGTYIIHNKTKQKYICICRYVYGRDTKTYLCTLATEYIPIVLCESLTRHSYFEPITARVGWESPLHAWLASVNRIGCAHCTNRRYRSWAHGMHYHILLRQCSQNCYTDNGVVRNTYSRYHKDASVQISIPNGCRVTKTWVKHVLVAERYVFNESVDYGKPR